MQIGCICRRASQYGHGGAKARCENPAGGRHATLGAKAGGDRLACFELLKREMDEIPDLLCSQASNARFRMAGGAGFEVGAGHTDQFGARGLEALFGRAGFQQRAADAKHCCLKRGCY